MSAHINHVVVVLQQVSLEEVPAKKLRLTKPSKSAALHIDLCKATSPTDALQYLLSFARRPVEAESVEGVVRILLEHYYKESDNSVRLKIASLLGLLSKTQGFAPDCIVDDAINTLNNEKSHQVLAQLLGTLLIIGTQLPDKIAVVQRLIDVACKHLSSTYFGVRNKCLQLLGCLGTVDKPLSKETDAGPGAQTSHVRDVQSVISDYFQDQDPRVRTAAIKAMLQLHERGMKIQQTIYNQACKLLSDDYEQVRSAAVQMVWVLSQLYPESIVPIPSSNEEIRLVDDSFGKICHMVSDGSWVVRVQAAKLLGSMHQVSPHFLEQTLDKKLMSDLRRKRTAHERAKELYASGEFSSGRRWADDAPKEKVDTSGVNLIDSGACGAFVHGLEDEMYEVRISAVEALCSLAQSSPSFAEKCLDFLVDMFNDEIEEVRLQSIHVLRQISTHITLREDQLDTVLAVLEDSSRDIREALHELLCYTNVSTKDLAVPVCSSLSSIPRCSTPDPGAADYIAVLVLVFNAAKSCPTMPALFSDHTFRHYAYLRDSLSHLVPHLRLPGRKQTASSGLEASGVGSGSLESAQNFLQDSLVRVSALQNLETPGAQDLLEFTIRDLLRLGELQTELAGSADFCATYLHCQLLLTKALQEKLWTMAVPLCLKQNAKVSTAARQILDETYKLEFLYSGLETQQIATIHNIRLQAKALQLILTARSKPGVDRVLGACEKFLQDVESFQRLFMTELPHFQDSFVEKLLELMPRLTTCKPLDLVKILQTTLRQSGFIHLKLPEQIHRASATIIEPTGESDNPLKFTTGLVVALDIDATLEHVQDPQTSVKVQVLYPDGQSHIIHPKPGDFRTPGPGRVRLITQVYLSHSAWTEACQIEVRLLLAYSSSSSKQSASKPAWNESMGGLPTSESCIESTIHLSKPVKVFIMPKPARR
uniref:Integrator complex subunit 4 n=1 Tax=Cyprinus carpio TaxID=7962 RepID=A0A8C1GK89_CYPCA